MKLAICLAIGLLIALSCSIRDGHLIVTVPAILIPPPVLRWLERRGIAKLVRD